MTSSAGAPLRVTALAASAQLGGTERVLLDFANRAFEHEVALRVITPRGGPLVDILNKIGVPAEVVHAPERMLRGSQQLGQLWSLPAAVLSLVGWSRRVAEHPFVRDAQVIYTISFKTHLAAAFARLHPVVWHLHEFPPTTTGAFWRWLSRRVPEAMIANSEAAGGAWGSAERGAQSAEKNPSAHAGREFEVRPRTAHRAPRRGAAVVVVHNGVNLDRFKPRDRTGWIHDELQIPRDRRLIGMPAVFARWKGQVEVMQAFELIKDDFPAVDLVIVGGSIYDTVAEQQYGEELTRITGQWAVPKLANTGSGGAATSDRAAYSVQGAGDDAPRTAHRAPRSDRIHMLPFQREIELAFPEFDIAVHYSLRPEPFGRVVLEAMACGVPVIAAGEGGPVEILGARSAERGARSADASPLHQTPAGWLAVPRDVHALADTLRQALSLSPDQLRAVGAAGRRRAEDQFSARRFAGRVAEVLREVDRES